MQWPLVYVLQSLTVGSADWYIICKSFAMNHAGTGRISWWSYLRGGGGLKLQDQSHGLEAAASGKVVLN